MVSARRVAVTMISCRVPLVAVSLGNLACAIVTAGHTSANADTPTFTSW
jgi:hypothetical protein